MTISELVKELEKLKKEYGDIQVKTQTMTHIWDPEIRIKNGFNGKYILLND